VDFSWSEESLVTQQITHQFAQDKLLAEYQNNDNKHAFDKMMPKKMRQLELIGTELTETYAGLELGYLDTGLIVEGIALAGFNVACVQILAGSNSNIISKIDSAHIANNCIPKVIRCEKFGRDAVPYSV